MIAGRIAAQRALKRNKISDDQIDIISLAADAVGDHPVMAEVVSLLSEGKIDKEFRPVLTKFIKVMEEE